ncbi:hypothetical protein [Kitasatospora sp. MMS16-BH015]|nr:hypothetical protein [Kitasatospora sp. MMS16-BH015]
MDCTRGQPARRTVLHRSSGSAPFTPSGMALTLALPRLPARVSPRAG